MNNKNNNKSKIKLSKKNIARSYSSIFEYFIALSLREMK